MALSFRERALSPGGKEWIRNHDAVFDAKWFRAKVAQYFEHQHEWTTSLKPFLGRVPATGDISNQLWGKARRPRLALWAAYAASLHCRIVDLVDEKGISARFHARQMADRKILIACRHTLKGMHPNIIRQKLAAAPTGLVDNLIDAIVEVPIYTAVVGGDSESVTTDRQDRISRRGATDSGLGSDRTGSAKPHRRYARARARRS